MNKYVILIQPQETDADLLVNRPTLPLALLSISRYICKNYSIIIVDQRVGKDWRKKLLEYIKYDVICIGITCLLGNQIKYALEISKFVKSHFKCPVIWGGIHDPSLIRQVLNSLLVDGVVQGEGEETFTEVVRRLDKKENLDNFPCFWFEDSKTIYSNIKSKFLNMDLFPDLPYHLIDINQYTKFRGEGSSIPIETSRGCNFKCTFCACPQYSYVWRGMSASRVVLDIKNLLKKYKVKFLIIVDDNFFGSISRAKEIFSRLIEEHIRVNLDIQGMRVDAVEQMSDEDLRCMVMAGVQKVNIGIESGSSRILQFIKKGININRALEQNRRLYKFGPWVQYNFVTGFPTETYEEMRETVRLALHLLRENKKAMLNYFCIFTLIPGSGLYEFEKGRGASLPEKIEDWIKYDRIYGNKLGNMRLNRKLNIISLFVDDKVSYYVKSRPLRILVRLYRPIAKFRIKHLFFKSLFEEKIFMLVNKLKFD